MTETKQFLTLEVASCVTGVGLCESTTYAKMQEVMSWLCGWDVYTHEMVHEPTKDAALTNAYKQFPLMPTRMEAKEDWKAAAKKAVTAYGPTVTVRKGPGKRHESPLDTLNSVAPNAQPIVVKP